MTGARRTREARRLTYASTVAGATFMVVLGVGLAVRPSLNDLAGQWRQHELATAALAQESRYGRALVSAYEVVADDFEASVVSFEVGALPTTVDGRVIGLPGSPPAVPALPDDENSLEVEEAQPAIQPPSDFRGILIRIPSIGLSQTVVEGVDRDALAVGPGHYPGTQYPGFTGNVVISGHRTTYTKPFHDLDRLVSGDVIEISTPIGVARYAVRESFIVDPTDLGPLAGSTEAVLTLTTCNPKGSAKERLIVIAALVGEAFDVPGPRAGA